MGEIEHNFCHRCTMRFRIGVPLSHGNADHEAYTCPECMLCFHCTGGKSRGKSIAIPYLTKEDIEINEIKEEIQ